MAGAPWVLTVRPVRLNNMIVVDSLVYVGSFLAERLGVGMLSYLVRYFTRFLHASVGRCSGWLVEVAIGTI